jgi:WD40 repeat protein
LASDGDNFVVSQDNTARIWDASTGELLQTFTGHGSGGYGLAWSPSGNRIAVVGEFDTPIIERVWPFTQALIDEAHDCCVFRDLTPEERQ